MSDETGPQPPGVPAAETSDPDIVAVLGEVIGEERTRAGEHGVTYGLLWRQLERTVLGGKQFRGRLVTAVHRGLGGSDRWGAAHLGAAFEVLHAGFLVHDDLIDRDTQRRGEPNLAASMRSAAQRAGASDPAAQHFAEASAVLAGDLAVALAHRLLAQVEAPARNRAELSELLWDTIYVSVAGELDDVAASHGLWEVSHEKALRIASEKTAFYSFQAPLRGAAVLAQAPSGTAGSLDRIGRHLGQAFQLADDLVGLFAPEETTGKCSLSDLREGKVTSLLLHARTREVWSRISADIGRADMDEATARRIRAELAASGAPEAVDTLARSALARARAEVSEVLFGHDVVAVLLGACAMIEDSLDAAAGHVRAQREGDGQAATAPR